MLNRDRILAVLCRLIKKAATGVPTMTIAASSEKAVAMEKAETAQLQLAGASKILRSRMREKRETGEVAAVAATTGATLVPAQALLNQSDPVAEDEETEVP